jgi:hypothetical protein
MGALRAAELHSFGMIGVGSIFEGYRDGTLTDDDEVTVVHSDAEGGYRPLSTAMVDMRATLARAQQAQLNDQTLCRCTAGGVRAVTPLRQLLETDGLRIRTNRGRRTGAHRVS